MRKAFVSTFAAMATVCAAQAFAAPVVEVTGQSGIRADNPTAYGTGNVILWSGTVGGNGTLRGLHSFDLSNVGPFTVPDATLWYYIDRDDNFANAGGQQTVQVHELDRDFRFAADGGASWNEAAPGEDWDNPGGDFGPALASIVLDFDNLGAGDTFTLSSEDLRIAAQSAIDDGRELNLILRVPGLEGAAARTILWVQGPGGSNPAQLIIPEPASLALLSVGGLLLLRRRTS